MNQLDLSRCSDLRHLHIYTAFHPSSHLEVRGWELVQSVLLTCPAHTTRVIVEVFSSYPSRFYCKGIDWEAVDAVLSGLGRLEELRFFFRFEDRRALGPGEREDWKRMMSRLLGMGKVTVMKKWKCEFCLAPVRGIWVSFDYSYVATSVNGESECREWGY